MYWSTMTGRNTNNSRAASANNPATSTKPTVPQPTGATAKQNMEARKLQMPSKPATEDKGDTSLEPSSAEASTHSATAAAPSTAKETMMAPVPSTAAPTSGNSNGNPGKTAEDPVPRDSGTRPKTGPSQSGTPKPKEKWVTNPNIGLRPPDNPCAKSTPLGTPDSFTERRSPTSEIETEDDISGIGLYETPLGGGANHHLSDIVFPNVLPTEPTVANTESCISNLRDRIEGFGSHFRERVGWAGEFEGYASKLKTELNQLTTSCMSMQYIDQLEKVYSLSAELDEHLESMRSFATARKENENSPYNFRQPLLTTIAENTLQMSHHSITGKSTQDVSKGNPAASLHGRDTPTGRPLEDEGQKETAQAPPQEGIPPLPPSIRHLNLAIKALEHKKANQISVMEKFDAIETAKASKFDLSQLCLRVGKLEIEMQTVDDLQLQAQISEHTKKITGNTAACKRYETLAKGFCGENVKLRKELLISNKKIELLESEIQTLKSDISQLRDPELHGLYEEDMHSDRTCSVIDNDQVNDSTVYEGQYVTHITGQSNPTTSTIPADIMFQRSSPGIPGINQLPTSTITTLSCTYIGRAFTTSVMTSHIRPSTITTQYIPVTEHIPPLTRVPRMQPNSAWFYSHPQLMPGPVNFPDGLHHDNAGQQQFAPAPYAQGVQHSSLQQQSHLQEAERLEGEPRSQWFAPGPQNLGSQQPVNYGQRPGGRRDGERGPPRDNDAERGQMDRNTHTPVGSDHSHVSDEENLSRLGIRLKKAGRNLKKLLNPPVDSKLTKTTVIGIHKSLLPAVDSEKKEVQILIDRYDSQTPAHLSKNLLDEMEAIVEEARTWSREMREKYHELDCSKKSLDSKLYEGMKKFGESSEINIFEFLDKFETYTEEKGTAKERAELLYDHYLQKDLQMMLVEYKSNYAKMRTWLINRFGDVKVITENILRTLAKDVMPSDNNSSQPLANYYRKLNSVIKQVQELENTVDLPREDLNDYVHSNEFISKVLPFIPEKAKLEFYAKVTASGQDLLRIKGETAFIDLATIVYQHFLIHEGNCRVINSSNLGRSHLQNKRPEKQASPPKKKGVHAVKHNSDTQRDDDDVDTQVAVHFQKTSQPRKDDKSKGQKSKVSKFKFPCCLKDHSHELGECESFFKKPPLVRKQSATKHNCFSCLGPYETCKSGCKAKVPTELLCTECKVWADQNNRPPINVLLCRFRDHTKPDNKTLSDSLKKYLKNFNPDKVQGPIKLAAHLHMAAHTNKCPECKTKDCDCRPPTLSSKVDPKAPIPIIDTNTGKSVTVPKEKIIPKSKHDAFYIMQLLSMRGRDVLTFYDRGANDHLIEGQLAEDINLKVVNDRSAVIGVAGGGKLWTGYGTYAVILGPTEDGYFHEVYAQGIERITDKFPHYDLDQINKEVRKSKLLPPGNHALPKYIGGQTTSLLLGINDTGIDPTTVFRLPNGLAVLKSPFVDKFGTRYCYGGPHELFSKVNKKLGNNFNHLCIFFTQMVNQYRNSPHVALLKSLQHDYVEGDHGIMFVNDATPKSRIDTQDGIELYPSAINEIDMQEMGIPESDPYDYDADTCICDHETSDTDTAQPLLGVYKAKIPVSQRKEYMDEEDQGLIYSYRCEDCAKCKKCLLSDRNKMMSLQEKMEQEAIEKSVHVNLEEMKVYVDLPFIKPPVEALTKKHYGADTNYKQALKIYQTQCRKPDKMKTEMRKVHQDLVNKGFMKKLCDLNPEQQSIVNNAKFRHIMPWRIAEKLDSLSTPYRMVVDASVTGLNDILAKGENRMSKINHILIRNRCRRYIWSSDISKLYNQLHLRDSALPYGLFLFHETMDPNIEPEVYVMVVAWYGVSSTGNQSAEALERLTTLLQDKYPSATDVVKEDLYVDDTLSGDNDKEKAETQIRETQLALEQGGFKLKYVVRSGEEPCQEASSDGESLKILGHKWNPKQDILAPGFGELNFNRRKRGSKKPNPFPVISKSDVSKLLDSTNITRRLIFSKTAEFWDPSGIWEPFKLQLKLDSQPLNGLGWDVALDKDTQLHWTNRFHQFLEIPAMNAERCVVPEDAVDPDKLRLICISDAAEKAGGCAIYAGFKRLNGMYSCKLLTARSKLMNQKIPRNELEGIRLMAETANSVQKALGTKVEETLYFTDSTIAMCWCHNTAKKLRMFTLYRVADIRRFILGTVGSHDQQELPLYHIDGKLNIADLLTKHHDISPKDLGIGTPWQDGLPWMQLPLDEMPITTYSNLTFSNDEESVVNQECFPEPILSGSQEKVASIHLMQLGARNSTHCHGCKATTSLIPTDQCYGPFDYFDHCDGCDCPIKFSSFALKAGRGSQALVDIIKHGWLKSIRVLSHIQKFCANMIHTLHISKGVEETDTCKTCIAHRETSGIPEEMDKIYTQLAKDYLFRLESERIKSILPKKKIESFIEDDGILYHEGRLVEENPITQSDLGFDVFFDNTQIKSILPVVLADSELFFCYAMYIHHRVRLHSGVEITVREIFKTMMVLNNPRKVIQKIRRDCPKCRIIAKRTLELKMSHHPAARTHLAPPFYHCQVDTVFGFRGQSYKNARKTMKIYALVIVCLLTGATSILALEGLETQDIIQAIERHSSRHGVPAVMYVDNGTQLIALENTTFKLRDLQTQVYDSLGLKIVVSTAKSHEERGRVEAKVKILRNMLEKLSVSSDTSMTSLQWETLFAKISSMIDDVPLAKCANSNVNDPGWDIITANRLKLGRNNNRSLEGWIDLSKGAGAIALLRRNQELQKVWYQMLIDKIHHLIPRPSKWNKTDKINVGDIVLFIYTENAAMGKDVWKLGRVESIPSKSKIVISFPGLVGSKGLPKLKTITRSPRNISIISAAGEVELNSRKYFEQIVSKV